MSERRVLVIGSQCDALVHLPFLPKAAEELYAVMTDPERGACLPALEESGLFINPNVDELAQTIEAAYLRAAKHEATLFIVYIGHGATLGRNFYLLPKNAKEHPLTSKTAVPLIDLILETHLNSPAPGRVDGLGVLLDTCHSGRASYGAVEAWIADLQGTLRFEMLTAAADLPAADGCFTKALTKILREGIEKEPSEYLLGLHVRPLIEDLCPNQVPQHPSWNPDQTLWLSRNAGRILEPWSHTAVAEEIQRLTLAYQPTPALAEIVELSKANGCIAVVGEAGAGKSALAAALAWPTVTEGEVPARFVQAVAFVDEATTPSRLASVIAQQLARSVPGFRKAQEVFGRETPYAERQKAGILEKQLIGPLKQLNGNVEIRLVVDALDRLATGARGPVIAALEELSSIPFVRLLVTAPPDARLPKGAMVYRLARAPERSVRKFLAKIEIPPARRGEIAETADGNWLVVRVLADLLHERPDAEIGRAGQPALWDAYEEMLVRCGAIDGEATSHILGILAAAGAGPLLPLSLLCKASQLLGGVTRPADVRDHLVRLRGLAVRSSAGTEREQAGLFHQTLVDYIAGRATEKQIASHRALVAGILALSPIGPVPLDLNDPVHRYAFEREAEHLWAIGEAKKALEALAAKLSPAPRDNLRRWGSWLPQVEQKYGPDHYLTLATRGNFARWTGECGDTREALRLFRALLPDYDKVFGTDHCGTLMARHNIAAATARCGDRIGALQLYHVLLVDQERVLGLYHPDALLTRSNIARSKGELGDVREALRRFRELLSDLERVLGPDHSESLRARNNIAYFTGVSGDTKEALRLFQALVSDLDRVLGPDHPETLRSRNYIAHFTGVSGDIKEALRLLQALLPEQERVLNPAHPDAFATRHKIAFWTAERGDYSEALGLFQTLLPELEHAVGPSHPETLNTKRFISSLMRQGGGPSETVWPFQGLLPPVNSFLGPDQQDILKAQPI